MIQSFDDCITCNSINIDRCGICTQRICYNCGTDISITCLNCKRVMCEKHVALCWCQCTDGICTECIDHYKVECNVSKFYEQNRGYICYDCGNIIHCTSCYEKHIPQSKY